MIIPIRVPIPSRFGRLNIGQQRGPVSDGSNSFIANSFVKLSSGELAAVATGDVVCYGYVFDASKAAGLTPPEAFFGQNHYVCHPEDVVFEINAAAFSTNTATIGSSGVTWTGGSIAVGNRYGIGMADNSGYEGVHMLNTSDTTNDFFEVIALAPNQAVTDNNPRLLVKILKSIINP